jgi:hypothetical protein
VKAEAKKWFDLAGKRLKDAGTVGGYYSEMGTIGVASDPPTN